MVGDQEVRLRIYSSFRKHSAPFDLFNILLRYALILKWIEWKYSSAIYTQYPKMTKQKSVFRDVCKKYIYIFFKRKYFIYISFQTLCYETRNWVHVQPVSIDHPWDVSTSWLESTCGKFNWLDMICEGAHTCLYKVIQLTVHVRAKTKPWGWRNCR